MASIMVRPTVDPMTPSAGGRSERGGDGADGVAVLVPAWAAPSSRVLGSPVVEPSANRRGNISASRAN
jgi:hypothetical protein